MVVAASRLILYAAVLSFACSGDPASPLGPSQLPAARGLGPVVAFEIVSNRPRGAVSVGDTLRFIARATHVSGGARDVDADWHVSPARSLEFQSPPAVFIARRAGAVTVTASYAPADSDGARYTARSDLTVIAPFVDPVRHVIAGWPEVDVRRLRVGERHGLALLAEYEDGSRSEPLVAQWSSSRPDVASVNALGTLETLASGSFRVTATAPAAVVRSPSWSVSQGANRPPVVAAECRPCDVSVGQGVHLSASNASDPDGDALTVEWSVPAGVVRYPQRFETDWFLPQHAGSFTATVVVTDPYGLTHSDFVTVYVTAPG